ncbi:MAG: maleylpyruvate isomerase [Ilumatobacteraceae bacterium]
MNELERDLAGVARAQAVLLADLQGLVDDQVGRPSALPGWTVGHVATHIARNAEGHIRMLSAAARGEVAAMYPGGREQRTSDIEAGSRRSAAELVADVTATANELAATWASMPEAAWSGRGDLIGGEALMSDLPFIRWREVSVHHSDLGIGFTWSDWEPEYVRVELVRLTMLWASRKPMGLTDLPPEALSVPPHHRAAWLLGRAEIEGLAPAGIIN